MARILVIEDEADLREMLGFAIRGAGHHAALAADGTTGLAEARGHRPDLVLLDLMLPDRGGLEICRELKTDPATRTIPIVMLTAKDEEIDRVVGFELGADDYVVKPFSTRELMLRLQAILRRTQEAARTAAAEPTGPRDRIRFGKLVVDRTAHRVWVEDQEVTLTALEFKLLGTLLDRRERVQSRGTLLSEVWGMSEDIATRTVDTHVKRLREKLGAAGDYLETVRGVGYRFVGDPGRPDVE